MIHSMDDAPRVINFAGTGKWIAGQNRLFLAKQKSFYGPSYDLSMLVMLLLLLIGGILRFFNLDAHGLWNDELHTWEIIGKDFQGIWLTTGLEPHPPLYNLLMSVIVRVLSPSEFNLRLLSAISSWATVLALGFYLSRTRYGWTAAVAGMFFISTAPVQIYYAQEARVYALAGLWVILSLSLFQQLERSVNWRIGIVYLFWAILGLYLNYFLAVVLLAQIIWLGFQPAMRQQKWFWICALLPWVTCLPAVLNSISPVSMGTAFNQSDSVGQTIGIFSAIESMMVGDIRYVPRLVRWFALGLVIVLGLAGLLHLKQRSVLYLLIAGVPIVIVTAVLPLLGWQPPHYQEKQFIVLAPVAWALVGIGSAFLWHSGTKYLRAFVLLLCIVWIGGVSLALQHYFSDFIKSPEQAMVNSLLAARSNKDPVLVTGNKGMAGALNYYAPDIPCFVYRVSSLEDPIIIPGKDFMMFATVSSFQHCHLTDLTTLEGVWLIGDTLQMESVELVNTLKKIKPIEFTTRIDRYELYHIAGTSGQSGFRCSDFSD